MFHGSWDMEVHAREIRDRHMRRADRERRAAAAVQGRRREGATLGTFGPVRLLAAARDWLFAPARVVSRAPGALPEPEPVIPDRGRSLPHLPSARPNRLAEPYAHMVVIARGTPAARAEEPCGAWDC
jgi:hypothetical protein